MTCGLMVVVISVLKILITSGIELNLCFMNMSFPIFLCILLHKEYCINVSGVMFPIYFLSLSLSLTC